MRNILMVLSVAMMASLFIIRPVLSYADWGGHDGHGGHGGHGGGNWHGHGGGYGHSYVGVNFSVWPDSYYYGAPYYPYYPPTDEVLVSAPIEETVVQPPQVVVNQAEPAAGPVITTAGTESDTADSFTINIPNDKGGYTAVILKKSGNGFIGPQGEFYAEFPKVSQLKVMYGK